MKTIKLIMAALLIAILPASFNNCSRAPNASKQLQGTSTGNPRVHVQIAGYAPGTTSSISTLAINDLTICVQEMHFRNTQNPAFNYDSNMRLGLFQVRPDGTDLGQMYVRPGEYDSVFMDLDAGCVEGGRSVSLVNSNGSFSSTNLLTLRFYGVLVVQEYGLQSLVFDMQRMIDGANTVTSNAEIPAKFGGVTGLFQQQ